MVVNQTLETVKRTPQDLLLDRGLTFDECYAKHNRLTGYVMKKLRGLIEVSGVDREDIKQECSIGLYEAFTKFDCTRDVKFATYAIMHVRGRALRYLRDYHSLIRKPRTVYALEKFCRENAITQFEELLPHYPRLSELGLNTKKLKRLYVDTLAYRDMVSTNAIYSTPEGDTPLSEMIGVTDLNYSTVDFEHMLTGLNLSSEDLNILQLRLEGYTQLEIGKIYGISQVAAGRRLKAVKRKMKVDHIRN